MKNVGKMLAMTLGIISAIQLVGCGNHQASINDYGKDETSIAASDNQKEAGDQADDYGIVGDKIPNHVTCSLVKDSKRKSLEIDADVISDGIDQAKVYEKDCVPMSEEEVIEYANFLFDNGQYEVVLPYEYWSKKDLENEKQRLEKMVNEEGSEYMLHPLVEINISNEFLLDSFDDEKPEEPKDGKIFFKKKYDIYESYVAFLRGKIKGKEYELKYDNGDIYIAPLFPVTKRSYIYSLDDSMGENPCNKSAANKRADELVEAITDDFSMVSCLDRAYVNEDTMERGYDGVYLHYTRNFPELSPAMCEFMFVHQKEPGVILNKEDENRYPLENYSTIAQDYINMEMDQNGDLISMQYHVYGGLSNAVGDDIQFLSFSKVMKSLDEFLDEFVDKDKMVNNWSKIQISEIRLSYLPVKIEDGVEVYIPYWVFLTEENTDSTTGISTAYFGTFAVNAIDGSCVVIAHNNGF